jgi:modulator of FtsH protease HflK
MPWNDNSNGSNGSGGGGGPWGAGGGSNGSNQGGKDDGPKNPWGTGNNTPSRRPGSTGPSGNLDDLAKKVEDRLKSVLGGGGGGGGGFNPRGPGGGGSQPVQFDRRAIGGIALVALLGWFATGVYVVNTGEEAVIQRFGKYVRTVGPGLNFHIPVPFESRTKVDVQRSNSLSVGAGEGAEGTDGLMLTGDQNIVDVGFQVNWRVDNSRDYLFQVAHGNGPNGRPDPQVTVRAVAEAAIREVVGRSQRDQVLATGRAQVEAQTRELIQRTLNLYRAGISISEVNLTKAEPPAAVNEAFREVAAASQEAETKINQARTYRNAVVPQAQGEAARFNQLYQEYKLAPDVTRQRLYLETMEKVYERANKVLLDPGKAGSTPMVVLPPELFRNQTGQAPVVSNNANTPSNSTGGTSR